MTLQKKSNEDIVNDLRNWYQGMIKSKRVPPHDSYDASCCEGDNSSLHSVLVAKIKSILGET